MIARIEQKYLLNHKQYESLLFMIGHLLKRDDHSRYQAYPVTSIYYDTKQFDFLMQKLDGDFDHDKIRVRTYGTPFSDGFSFLEFKIKRWEKGGKIRLPMNKIILDPMLWRFIIRRSRDAWLEPCFNQVSLRDLRPVCGVYFDRIAFEMDYQGDSVRVTFDQNLRLLVDCQETRNLVGRPVLLPDELHCVLEVKSAKGELPSFLKRIFSAQKIQISPFSKYARAYEILIEMGIEEQIRQAFIWRIEQENRQLRHTTIKQKGIA